MHKLLVVGSTGMLGQAIMRNANDFGFDVTGVARSNADICLHLGDTVLLEEAVRQAKPDVVINCAAIVNLADCENEPAKAYLINSRPAGILADLSLRESFKLVYISTDHFFDENGRYAHKENDPIVLVNEYARTKYIGECFSGVNSASLILRTNIVGHRNKKDSPTFVEWAINSLINRIPMTLFDDVFTSSIHVDAFSKAMFELILKDISGIHNLASSEVSSKAEFIQSLADGLGIKLDWTTNGSGKMQNPPRAVSSGLDVTKTEELLGYKLPDLNETIKDIVDTHQNLLSFS